MTEDKRLDLAQQATMSPTQQSDTSEEYPAAAVADRSGGGGGVYDAVANMTPRERAEHRRVAAAVSAPFRYSTRPIHMAIQHKLASLMAQQPQPQSDPTARCAADNVQSILTPRRPTTAPHAHGPPTNMHQFTAPNGHLHRPDKGASKTRPCTAAAEQRPRGAATPSTTTSASDAVQCGGPIVASGPESCEGPPLPDNQPLDLSSTVEGGTSTLPPEDTRTRRENGGVDDVAPEDMLSTPVALEYLDKLLERVHPFDAVTSGSATSGPLIDPHDADGCSLGFSPSISLNAEYQHHATVAQQPNASTGGGGSSTDDEAVKSTHTFLSTPPMVAGVPPKRVMVIPVGSGGDLSLLEIVPPLTPRPHGDATSVVGGGASVIGGGGAIARTMSVARGLRPTFPSDINCNVPYIDIEGSLSPESSCDRIGRMSFRLQVDAKVKHANFRSAAVMCSYTSPEHKSSNRTEEPTAVGTFSITQMTVNGSLWSPPSCESEPLVAEHVHVDSFHALVVSSGLFLGVIGKDLPQPPSRVPSKRQASLLPFLSLDGVVDVALGASGCGKRDTVLLTVTHSSLHSSHIRLLFYHPNAPAYCKIVIHTPDPAGLMAALSSASFQRLRAMADAAKEQRTNKKLVVVHFNDVYNLIQREGDGAAVVGGAARFHTKLMELRERYNPLVLFSGDFMGPSLMSVDMKGKQMVDFFNQCGVHYGCFGNHEFDYGLKALQEVIQGFTLGAHVFTGSNTKWVMTNMFEANGMGPVCGASTSELFTWNGVRVGLVGLCEDWLAGCSQLVAGEVVYVDMFEAGEHTAKTLKLQGAEVVIALTHCRLANDKELMRRCPSIDLLLGGHDHYYKCIPSLHIVKSGEEFQYLTQIDVEIEGGSAQLCQSTSTMSVPGSRIGSTSFLVEAAPWSMGAAGSNPMTPVSTTPKEDSAHTLPMVVHFNVVAHPIHADIEESPQMMKMIDRYQSKLDERMGGVVGRTPVPLDPRESTVRFREGLLTGFVCDVVVQEMRAKMIHADFAIIGGAAFSGKTVIPAGNLTMGHIFDLFPNDTRVMCLRMQGRTLQRMLTVMVRECPSEAPSFPHCSADLSFTISLIGGGAPKISDVRCRGEPLVEDRLYTVAVEDFAGKGSGKYKFLRTEAECLIEEENAAQVVFWLIDYFSSKKGQSRSTDNGLEEEAVRADMERAAKRNRKQRRKRNERRGSSILLQSAVDLNLPKFVLPLRQFKPVEFATTLDSGALARLYAATTLLSEDVESISNIALIENVVVRLLKCTACRVYLYDQASGVLRALMGPQSVSHMIQVQLPADSSSLVGFAVANKCVVNTKNASKDPSFSTAVDGSPSLRVVHMLTFPIFYRKICLGAVQALNKQPPDNAVAHEWRSGSDDDAFGTGSSSDVSTTSEELEESSVSLGQRPMPSPHGATLSHSAAKAKRRTVPPSFTEEDQGLALLLSKQIGVQMHFSNMFQRVQQSEAATKNLMEMARLLGRAQKDDSVQAMVLRITDIGKQLIGCDRCSLFLIDKGEMWTVVKTKDLSGNITIRLPIGTGVAGHVAQTGSRMNIHDAYQSPYFNPETDRRTGYLTRTMLAVPMVSENKQSVLGVLQLINKNNGKVFTKADEELAENFVNLAAIAIHNSFEIETLRLGRDESTLQVLPVHDLKRITIKQGWRTVRNKIHMIAALRAFVLPRQKADQNPALSSRIMNPLGLRYGTVDDGIDSPLDSPASSSRESGRHQSIDRKNQPNDRSAAVAQAMMDFDDLRSESDDG